MVQLVITTTLFSGFFFTHPFGVRERERERERLVQSGPRGGEDKKKSTLFECQCIWYKSTNTLGTLIFTSPTGDATAILRGHLSHVKV